MIKALSAVAISALIAAAVSLPSGLAPQLEAGEPVALQNGGALVIHAVDIHAVDGDCTKQTWPNFSASCLRGSAAKSEARLVSFSRG